MNQQRSSLFAFHLITKVDLDQILILTINVKLKLKILKKHLDPEILNLHSQVLEAVRFKFSAFCEQIN